MSRFIHHIQSLSNKPSDIDLWGSYFSQSSEKEIMLSIHLVMNPRKYRITNSAKLKLWVQEYTKFPLWIIEKSQKKIKDATEGLSLVLPRKEVGGLLDIEVLDNEIAMLKTATDKKKKAFVKDCWSRVVFENYYLLNRLLTGLKLKEVNNSYLEMALAIRLNMSVSWIKYCLVTRYYDKVGYKELFDNEDENLTPTAFENILECKNFVDIRRNKFITIQGGNRVQLASNGQQVICWSEGYEMIDVSSHLLLRIREVIPDVFTIEGELIGEEFNLWIIHKASSAVALKLVDYFDTKYNYFNSIEELELFQKGGDLGQTVGLLAINSNKLTIIPAPRHYLNAVLIYAQKSSTRGSKYFEQLTVGLYLNQEYISVGKISINDFEDKESETLRSWILENKIERVGPITLVPPYFVLKLSCAYITISKRHKAGHILHGLRLEKSQLFQDLGKVSPLSFLAEHTLKS